MMIYSGVLGNSVGILPHTDGTSSVLVDMNTVFASVSIAVPKRNLDKALQM